MMLAGCDVDSVVDSRAHVRILAVHHGTPDPAGDYPDYGADEKPRIFTNDQGWEITLFESYFVLTGVAVGRCGGGNERWQTFDMHFGTWAENVRDEDLSPRAIASADLPGAHYCDMQVLYGPFEDTTVAESPDTAGVVGHSAYVQGQAVRDGSDPIAFEVAIPDEILVELDLGAMSPEGDPLRIEGSENLQTDIVVAKTYDRVFDGVDFSNFSDADLRQRLTRFLRSETHLWQREERLP